MTFDLQTILSVGSALLSVTTLGFILSLMKEARENAKERAAVQEDRYKGLVEHTDRERKLYEQEKHDLTNKLNSLSSEMEGILKNEGLTLEDLALGRQLSLTAANVKLATEGLVKEITENIHKFSELSNRSPGIDPRWQLSVAKGAMASGSYSEAASNLDAYANNIDDEKRTDEDAWRAHLTRGVAHANALNGRASDLAALRAYNEAIAVAPSDLPEDTWSKLFCYRGAMLKRLGRLDEALSDLKRAASRAQTEKTSLDAHYNLAGVYALSGKRDEMYSELDYVKSSPRYRLKVQAHASDYFKIYAAEGRFREICSG